MTNTLRANLRVGTMLNNCSTPISSELSVLDRLVWILRLSGVHENKEADELDRLGSGCVCRPGASAGSYCGYGEVLHCGLDLLD